MNKESTVEAHQISLGYIPGSKQSFSLNNWIFYHHSIILKWIHLSSRKSKTVICWWIVGKFQKILGNFGFDFQIPIIIDTSLSDRTVVATGQNKIIGSPVTLEIVDDKLRQVKIP